MGRGGFDEYEEWLSMLDTKFRVVNGNIRSDIDAPFLIPLHDCSDVGGIVSCATRLRKEFLSNPTHLPVKYLLKRFVQLVIDANQLPISEAEVLSKFPEEWQSDN